MIEISQEKIDSLENFVKAKENPHNEIHLVWLGQAGFAFKYKNKLFIIDPYLSDYLAKKYKGKIFPHVRLMNIPLLPEKIKKLNYLISTHAHSDHMDPETVRVLSDNNPDCKIIVPAAEIEEAINRGAKHHQIIPANDNVTIKLDDDVMIIGVGASHETLKINERGEYHFLGYVFDLGGFRIYHSGDCIPYKGLHEKIKKLKIDLALLPINGRDEYRLSNRIAGNFNIAEALNLSKEAEIKILIVHHFGMFAYNTVKEKELEELQNKNSKRLQIIIPKINTLYKFMKSPLT